MLLKNIKKIVEIAIILTKSVAMETRRLERIFEAKL